MGLTGKHTNDRLQGTLDLLILKSLASRGRMHGYGITQHIEQLSNEMLRLEEGSLYPALHRLTHAGSLRSEWGASENNRRAKFYSISKAGGKQLVVEARKWERVAGIIGRLLQLGTRG